MKESAKIPFKSYLYIEERNNIIRSNDQHYQLTSCNLYDLAYPEYDGTLQKSVNWLYIPYLKYGYKFIENLLRYAGSARLNIKPYFKGDFTYYSDSDNNNNDDDINE